MPRPTNPLDLIRWDEGAPRFDARGEQGLGGWWADHYREARLFFLVCAQERVLATNYPGRRALHAFIEPMLNDIPQEWRDALPHESHWDSFHTTQARDAMERRRLGLIKALQSAVLIEKYLEAQGEDIDDYYEHIFVKPATYRVLHEAARFPANNRDVEAILPAIEGLDQPFPGRVITEHSAGMHVCFATAQSIAQAQQGAVIDFARRVGERGMTKPACNALRYRCAQ